MATLFIGGAIFDKNVQLRVFIFIYSSSEIHDFFEDNVVLHGQKLVTETIVTNSTVHAAVTKVENFIKVKFNNFLKTVDELSAML